MSEVRVWERRVAHVQSLKDSENPWSIEPRMVCECVSIYTYRHTYMCMYICMRLYIYIMRMISLLSLGYQEKVMDSGGREIRVAFQEEQCFQFGSSRFFIYHIGLHIFHSSILGTY